MHFIFVLINLIPMVTSSHKIFLPEDYNPDEKPPSTPLLVRASLNLRNIISVSVINQRISLETTLRLVWKDPRITFHKDSSPNAKLDSRGFPYVLLPAKKADTIWVPDIFLDQAVTIRRPRILGQASSIRIHNDSSVRYSSR